MTKTPEELLAMRFGGKTIAENLDHAVKLGALIEGEAGKLRLPSKPSKRIANWMTVPNGPALGCDFLFDVLFREAYGRLAVPHGCRECFKVKVAPRTVRQLVAAWEIAKRVECRSKWGVDLYNRYSDTVYAGYFFTAGLDAARALFKVVREAFDTDAKLGPETPMAIKRGCSEYEVALGPSDRYEFTAEMAELETYLKARFEAAERSDHSGVGLLFWIDIAVRIGDETYLDFTGGKRRRASTLTYEP